MSTNVRKSSEHDAYTPQHSVSQGSKRRRPLGSGASASPAASPAAQYLLQMAAVQAVLQVTSHGEDLVLEVAERMLHSLDVAYETQTKTAQGSSSTAQNRKTVERKRGSDRSEHQSSSESSSKAAQLTAESLLEELENRFGPGPGDEFVGHRSGGLQASTSGQQAEAGLTLGAVSNPMQLGSSFGQEIASTRQTSDNGWKQENASRDDSAQPKPHRRTPSLASSYYPQSSASSSDASGSSKSSVAHNNPAPNANVSNVSAAGKVSSGAIRKSTLSPSTTSGILSTPAAAAVAKMSQNPAGTSASTSANAKSSEPRKHTAGLPASSFAELSVPLTASSSTENPTNPGVRSSASSAQKPEVQQPPASAESARVKERISFLKEENSMLKARQLCRKCKERPVNLTLLPCGHFIFCVQCGRSYDECPICHRSVLADVVTFMA